jgi:hypothetical protein
MSRALIRARMNVKSQNEAQSAAQTHTAHRDLYRLWLRLSPALAPLFLVFIALLVAWQYDPLHRTLTGDHGVFAYLSQLVADGFTPHKFAFNEQASLTFFLGGAAMRVGDLFGVHRLLALRAVGILCFGIVILLTYTLTLRWTRSGWAAFAAGAILVGFEGYGVRAATGLEPKAFMLAFGLATLLVLQKRQWFWAGALAVLAGLVWQIAWGYLIVALLLAFVQGGARWRDRMRALLVTLVPALGILAVYVVYFIARDAHVELFQQTILAPAFMHAPGERALLARAQQLYNTFLIGYSSHLIFGILGIGGLGIWLLTNLRPWKIRNLPAHGAYYLFLNRRTAGTLLVIAGFTLYSFLDFQNYPDWIPMLPFLALFAAWLLWQATARVLQFLQLAPRPCAAAFAALAAALLSASVAHAFLAPPPNKRMEGLTWQDQQRTALALNRALGAETPLWVVGRPELLFMMRRQNINPYIYLFGNVDGIIDRLEPGGFQQMLDDALAQKPGLLVLARLPKRKFSAPANYRALESIKKYFVPVRACRALGEGNFLVRPDLVKPLLSADTQNCVKK